MGQKYHFRDSRITLFILCTRVRRFGFKMASQVHDLVSNDAILDSKVAPDELGQLGRPAERAGQARPARPAGRADWPSLVGPGWPGLASSAGRPSGLAKPGRPGLASPAARSRLPAGGLLCRGGKEKRAGQRKAAARRRAPPPHSYRRRWVDSYK